MDDDVAAVTFGTDGWRATVEEFTTPRVRAVGQAVADHLRAAGADAPVVVGYDTREGSRAAAEELCRVVCANGLDAVIAERDTPTPVVAWTAADRGSGALQVTASHNPAAYNGVKFVTGEGAPALPAVTDRLESNLRAPEPLAPEEWGAVTEADLVGPYLEAAAAFAAEVGAGAGTDLGGVTVAYDAMHGSGRGVADELLSRAGAEVVGLRTDPDPEFGGAPPEPSAARLRELEARVADGDAGLGLASDGDADRVGVVTPDRGYVDPNWVFAVLYDYLLACAGAGAGDAVRTVSTTFLVDRIAEASGRAVRETPVGFKWVAEAMVDGGAVVGGEESGGFGLREHLPNKDGVLVGRLLAAAHAEEPLDARLDRLRAEYGDIVQDRISVDCPDDRKAAVLDALGDGLPDRVVGTEIERVGTADGFKLGLADGSWLLVRPSGTEPKLRVYAEGPDRGRVEALLEAGRELLEPHL